MGDYAEPVDLAPQMSRGTVTRMPTKHGDFVVVCYTETASQLEHVALIRGPVADSGAQSTQKTDGVAPLVRVHSECATGDLFGSRRCDCGEQLERAMSSIAAEPAGVLLYVRGHEGRGIGLGSKLKAYALQDHGRDTIEANTDQGLPIDARSYAAAASILADLGVDRIRLMTNNPQKCDALIESGIQVVERIPLVTTPNAENYKYLLTKQRKMGHLLNIPDDGDDAAAIAMFKPSAFSA